MVYKHHTFSNGQQTCRIQALARLRGYFGCLHEAYFLFLTPVFVTLFEEPQWPDDALEYAKKFFGSTPKEDIDAAVAENQRIKAEIQAVEAKIAEVQKQIEESEE